MLPEGGHPERAEFGGIALNEIISVEHLSFVYPSMDEGPGVTVFEDLDLKVEEGSFVAVLGDIFPPKRRRKAATIPLTFPPAMPVTRAAIFWSAKRLQS